MHNGAYFSIYYIHLINYKSTGFVTCKNTLKIPTHRWFFVDILKDYSVPGLIKS